MRFLQRLQAAFSETFPLHRNGTVQKLQDELGAHIFYRQCERQYAEAKAEKLQLMLVANRELVSGYRRLAKELDDAQEALRSMRPRRFPRGYLLTKEKD